MTNSFIEKLKNDLCKGYNPCKFCSTAYVRIITANNDENRLESPDTYGEFSFSENENTITIVQLSIPPYNKGKNVFKINYDNFVYDCESKKITIVDTGKLDKNNIFIALIQLKDIHISNQK